jgi:hypothetical protein
MDDMFIKIIRKKASYNYKKYMDKPDAWDNNGFNASLDDFHFYIDESLLFSAKIQTVANIPEGRFLDTIAPGLFQIKCFVENRSFYGRIHGIINTFDLDGQRIDENSIETVKGANGAPMSFTRWLMHDDQKLRPNPPNQITRVAWSAGCFVHSKANLEAFNTILDSYKVLPGDIINGELVEEE